MFDAKVYLDSLEKPTFIALDGTKYEGVLVSFNVALKYTSQMNEPESDQQVFDAVAGFMRELQLPAEAIEQALQLPLVGLLEMVTDFLGCLSGRRKTS